MMWTVVELALVALTIWMAVRFENRLKTPARKPTLWNHFRGYVIVVAVFAVCLGLAILNPLGLGRLTGVLALLAIFGGWGYTYYMMVWGSREGDGHTIYRDSETRK